MLVFYTWLLRKADHSREQWANLFWWEYNDIISGKVIWFRTLKGIKTVNINQKHIKYGWERQRKHWRHEGWTLSPCLQTFQAYCTFRGRQHPLDSFALKLRATSSECDCKAWRHIQIIRRYNFLHKCGFYHPEEKHRTDVDEAGYICFKNHFVLVISKFYLILLNYRFDLAACPIIIPELKLSCNFEHHLTGLLAMVQLACQQTTFVKMEE